MVLPWSSCRILLTGEAAEVDGVPQGIVGRLYVPETGQPALKHALTAFETRSVSLLALGIQQAANARGPDALIGAIPGDSPHSARMRELAEACFEGKECLVCSTEWADVVLVPRSPTVALEDGFNFLVFATNLKAADVCDIVRHQRKAVVVLDLDNTLVDAVAVAVTQKDWDALHWQPCVVTTESGRELPAQFAALMEHDPCADATYIMHWRLGKLLCTFKVRIRRGWERLREYLVRERAKYEVFVCSKGKQEYVQLLWHMLDPLSQLFPSTDWDWRLNSTFPDAVPRAVNKTLLAALGCTHPLEQAAPMQLACPVLCLDDCPKAYHEEYNGSVMFVEEYRPSDLFTADTGSVLRQAEERLGKYWLANYEPAAGGGEGRAAAQGGDVTAAGPWDGAVDAVVELMQDLLGEPLQFPEGLQEHHQRFAELGEWVRGRTSVRGVFGQRAYIGDEPAVLTTPPSPTAEAVPKAAEAAADTAAVAAAAAAITAEHAGQAAVAAEGAESPTCAGLAAAGAAVQLAEPGALPAAPAGRRRYVTAQSVLCALCQPSGACLPGCLACAALAAAASAGAQRAGSSGAAAESGREGGKLEDQFVGAEFELLLEGSPSSDDDLMGGWCDSRCSTPRSVAREVAGGGEGLALGGLAGELLALAEEEEEREAAAGDAFTSVDPSLQALGAEVFHGKLARISAGGHTLLLVPSARALSGRLDSGALSTSLPGSFSLPSSLPRFSPPGSSALGVPSRPPSSSARRSPPPQ